MQAYETIIIGGVHVVIFTDHNYALPIWGKHSSERNQSYHLVTFDFHADTHAPLSEFVLRSKEFAPHDSNHPAIRKLLKGRHYKRSSFCYDDALWISQYVKNDEHIQTADWFGYIDSYTVICHLSESEAECFEEEDRRNNNAATYYTQEQFKELDMDEVEKLTTAPFILDIDLDYFSSPRCLEAEFENRISILIRKAELITIAKEPTYCPSMDTWNCELILRSVLDLISKHRK